jgi:2-(1,2-epoxy-1,2-dihydrophenyl)acetyl-CoA isomerase
MTPTEITFEKMDGVGIITLNRPESRNALTLNMVSEMGEAIEACKRDDVRAVLITGAGGGFCSGADLKFVLETLEKGDQKGLQEYITSLANDLHHNVVIALRRLGKPVVAGINGVAAGAGFSLTLGCDIRVAARNARFLMAYANIGAPADGGSTYLLPRLIGAGRAMELYLASQPTSAQAALEMGLVNHVVEDDALHQHAMETAVRLAQGPTAAFARVKALFESSWENDLATQLDLETAAFADICLTADFQEGIKAFTERRQARFQGK